mgnify:FL=1
MKMKVVYIAGPFRASDAWGVHSNVHRAECAAREVARLGAMPLPPHSIGAHMDGTESAQFWLAGTLELMRRCDAVLVLPGYSFSEGTQGEIAEAERLGLPVMFPHDFATDTARNYGDDRFYDRVGYSLERLSDWLEAERAKDMHHTN